MVSASILCRQWTPPQPIHVTAMHQRTTKAYIIQLNCRANAPYNGADVMHSWFVRLPNDADADNGRRVQHRTNDFSPTSAFQLQTNQCASTEAVNFTENTRICIIGPPTVFSNCNLKECPVHSTSSTIASCHNFTMAMRRHYQILDNSERNFNDCTK